MSKALPAGECVMSEAATKRYLARIDSMTARLWRHHQQEDIRAEVRCAVFQRLARLSPAEQEHADGLVVTVIERAVAAFWRSTQNEGRQFFPDSRRPTPLVLHFDAERDSARGGVLEHAGEVIYLPAGPDFVPALIERLWGEQVWREVFALASPEEADLLREYCAGKPFRTISQERGWGRPTAQRRANKLLNRYRRACGLPLKADGTRARGQVSLSEAIRRSWDGRRGQQSAEITRATRRAWYAKNRAAYLEKQRQKRRRKKEGHCG